MFSIIRHAIAAAIVAGIGFLSTDSHAAYIRQVCGVGAFQLKGGWTETAWCQKTASTDGAEAFYTIPIDSIDSWGSSVEGFAAVNASSNAGQTACAQVRAYNITGSLYAASLTKCKTGATFGYGTIWTGLIGVPADNGAVVVYMTVDEPSTVFSVAVRVP